MKNKILFVIVCVLLLCPIFSANAEENGFLVKFVKGYTPDVYEYNLTEVNAKRGLYSVDDVETLKPIEEYIEYVEENAIVELIIDDPIPVSSVGPAAADSEYQQLKVMNVPAAWDIGSYGNEVRVAVIDTGCYAHSEYKDRLLTGKNYLTGTTDVTDTNGHGTHVAGIIAASLNGSGMSGVAPKAKIVPLKCFDGRQTSTEYLVKAVYDAFEVYDCDVINMSWGGSGSTSLKAAIEAAADSGAILVAAVGNDYSSTIQYPAGYDDVIGVASVDSEKRKSDFSQYNTSVYVAAFGEDVNSTSTTGGYVLMSGTSMATPMVAGVAAVALAIDPGMTSAEFKQLLKDTSEDLGTKGYDVEYGYGLVDVEALSNKMMKSMNCYVSPINVDGSKAYVYVRNNTSGFMNALGFFSQYTNSKFSSSSPSVVTLAPGMGKKVEVTKSGTELVYRIGDASKITKPYILRRSWVAGK